MNDIISHSFDNDAPSHGIKKGRMTVLGQFILNGNFLAAARRLRSFPLEAQIWVAISNRVDLSVDELVSVQEEEKAEEFENVSIHERLLPLHLACECLVHVQDDSFSTMHQKHRRELEQLIVQLVFEYPKACYERDSRRCLPLHQAICFNASPETVSIMLLAAPETRTQPDTHNVFGTDCCNPVQLNELHRRPRAISVTNGTPVEDEAFREEKRMVRLMLTRCSAHFWSKARSEASFLEDPPPAAATTNRETAETRATTTSLPVPPPTQPQRSKGKNKPPAQSNKAPAGVPVPNVSSKVAAIEKNISNMRPPREIAIPATTNDGSIDKRPPSRQRPPRSDPTGSCSPARNSTERLHVIDPTRSCSPTRRASSAERHRLDPNRSCSPTRSASSTERLLRVDANRSFTPTRSAGSNERQRVDPTRSFSPTRSASSTERLSVQPALHVTRTTRPAPQVKKQTTSSARAMKQDQPPVSSSSSSEEIDHREQAAKERRRKRRKGVIDAPEYIHTGSTHADDATATSATSSLSWSYVRDDAILLEDGDVHRVLNASFDEAKRMTMDGCNAMGGCNNDAGCNAGESLGCHTGEVAGCHQGCHAVASEDVQELLDAQLNRVKLMVHEFKFIKQVTFMNIPPAAKEAAEAAVDKMGGMTAGCDGGNGNNGGWQFVQSQQPVDLSTDAIDAWRTSSMQQIVQAASVVSENSFLKKTAQTIREETPPIDVDWLCSCAPGSPELIEDEEHASVLELNKPLEDVRGEAGPQPASLPEVSRLTI